MFRPEHWSPFLADTLAAIKADTLSGKLGDLETKALFYMLAYTLGELQAKTVAKKVNDKWTVAILENPG